MDKRFKVKTDFCICEMIAGVEKFLSLSDACKILNGLDKENKQLKASNRKFEIDSLNATLKVNEVEDENTQLKKENKFLRNRVESVNYKVCASGNSLMPRVPHYYEGVRVKDGDVYFSAFPDKKPDIVDVVCGYNTVLSENKRLKKEKHDIIQTILDYCNNNFNGHRDSFECLLDDIGWFDEAWLDNDGNIRPIEDLEKLQEEHE